MVLKSGSTDRRTRNRWVSSPILYPYRALHPLSDRSAPVVRWTIQQVSDAGQNARTSLFPAAVVIARLSTIGGAHEHCPEGFLRRVLPDRKQCHVTWPNPTWRNAFMSTVKFISSVFDSYDHIPINYILQSCTSLISSSSRCLSSSTVWKKWYMAIVFG